MGETKIVSVNMGKKKKVPRKKKASSKKIQDSIDLHAHFDGAIEGIRSIIGDLENEVCLIEERVRDLEAHIEDLIVFKGNLEG